MYLLEEESDHEEVRSLDDVVFAHRGNRGFRRLAVLRSSKADHELPGQDLESGGRENRSELHRWANPAGGQKRSFYDQLSG